MRRLVFLLFTTLFLFFESISQCTYTLQPGPEGIDTYARGASCSITPQACDTINRGGESIYLY